MKTYYALFDVQLGGFKSIASESYEEVVALGAERAFDLSESDEEPCEKGASDADILEEYGYEVREVPQDVYEKIIGSDEHGLLTTVTFV